ncbi:hypothetical protein KI387_002249, partial [Taxus chinensis]
SEARDSTLSDARHLRSIDARHLHFLTRDNKISQSTRDCSLSDAQCLHNQVTKSLFMSDTQKIRLQCETGSEDIRQ